MKHCENNAEESAHFYTYFNNVLHQARGDLCCAGTGVPDSQSYDVLNEAISLLWHFVFLDVFPEQERQSILVRKSKLTSAKHIVSCCCRQHNSTASLFSTFKGQKMSFYLLFFCYCLCISSESNCSVKNNQHIAKCEQLVFQWKLSLGA